MQKLKMAKVRVLPTEVACVMEVVEGKADAFIYDDFSNYRNWQKHPTETRAILEPFSRDEWGIGTRKDDDRLLLQVNAFIVAFKNQGGFQELQSKWIDGGALR